MDLLAAESTWHLLNRWARGHGPTFLVLLGWGSMFPGALGKGVHIVEGGGDGGCPCSWCCWGMGARPTLLVLG